MSLLLNPTDSPAAQTPTCSAKKNTFCGKTEKNTSLICKAQKKKKKSNRCFPAFSCGADDLSSRGRQKLNQTSLTGAQCRNNRHPANSWSDSTDSRFWNQLYDNRRHQMLPGLPMSIFGNRTKYILYTLARSEYQGSVVLQRSY